jgi:spore maturation protein CgeB
VTPPSIVVVSHFDDGEFAHAGQRVRALERLGCDVTPVDLGKRPGLLGRLTGADLEKRIAKAAADAEADLVLVLGGYELDESTVVLQRSATGVPWVNWFPDGLARLDDIAKVAAGYDRLYAVGSDVKFEIEARVGKPVEVLAHGADPSVYRPIKSRDQYRANVVFAGTATPAREAYLSGLVEYGLALWGPGWRRTSLKDYCRGEYRSTAEYVKAYGGATVAINLHRDLPLVPVDGRASCNQRVFELAAMGVAQVVDERSDLSRWFDVETQIATFRNKEQLKAQVEALLHNPPAAEAMASAARTEVLGRHTHIHRMQALLEGVGAAIPSARG